uniref:Putative secreted protein n=1 Tax=Ixodes ricinus TaxID=34613 RepID=A0A147BUB3_IXORI
MCLCFVATCLYFPFTVTCGSPAQCRLLPCSYKPCLHSALFGRLQCHGCLVTTASTASCQQLPRVLVVSNSNTSSRSGA